MLHYEIHVTVKTPDVEEFSWVCNFIGVKPIILDLQKKSGDVLCDVMTSSTITTDDVTLTTAMAELERISNHLKSSGFEVIRGKIETVPSHPDANVADVGKQYPNGQHLESHMSILISNEQEAGALRELARRCSLHLSKNPFKVFEDGSYVQMATYRSYFGNIETFMKCLYTYINELRKAGLNLRKAPNVEFAIYDTNAVHDLDWIDLTK